MGAATAALAIALLLADHESYVGLVQRALALTFMGWIACLGFWLITARPRRRVPSQARRSVPG
jgi:hypothetical protein